MATTITYDIKVNTKSINQLEQELADVNKELKGLKVGSTEFDALNQKSKTLQSALQGVQEKTKALTLEDKMRGLKGAADIASGAVLGVTGAMLALGGSGEEIAALEQDLIGVIAAVQGIAVAVEGIGDLTKAIGGGWTAVVAGIVAAGAAVYAVYKSEEVAAKKAAEWRLELKNIVFEYNQIRIAVDNSNKVIEKQIELINLQSQSVTNLQGQYNQQVAVINLNEEINTLLAEQAIAQEKLNLQKEKETQIDELRKKYREGEISESELMSRRGAILKQYEETTNALSTKQDAQLKKISTESTVARTQAYKDFQRDTIQYKYDINKIQTDLRASIAQIQASYTEGVLDDMKAQSKATRDASDAEIKLATDLYNKRLILQEEYQRRVDTANANKKKANEEETLFLLDWEKKTQEQITLTLRQVEIGEYDRVITQAKIDIEKKWAPIQQDIGNTNIEQQTQINALKEQELDIVKQQFALNTIAKGTAAISSAKELQITLKGLNTTRTAGTVSAQRFAEIEIGLLENQIRFQQMRQAFTEQYFNTQKTLIDLEDTVKRYEGRTDLNEQEQEALRIAKEQIPILTDIVEQYKQRREQATKKGENGKTVEETIQDEMKAFTNFKLAIADFQKKIGMGGATLYGFLGTEQERDAFLQAADEIIAVVNRVTDAVQSIFDNIGQMQLLNIENQIAAMERAGASEEEINQKRIEYEEQRAKLAKRNILIDAAQASIGIIRASAALPMPAAAIVAGLELAALATATGLALKQVDSAETNAIANISMGSGTAGGGGAGMGYANQAPDVYSEAPIFRTYVLSGDVTSAQYADARMRARRVL